MNRIISDNIYRYTSFESFVDIVQRQALSFVTFKDWEDPYEGLIFKIIQQEEVQRKAFEILKDNNYPREKIMLFYDTVFRFSAKIFGQSWSLCDNSDAMWRIYSHGNKSVRIETKKINIKKLETVLITKINYLDNIDIKQQIDAVLNITRGLINTTNCMLYKRKSFQHEKEIRLLYHDFDNINSYDIPHTNTLKKIMAEISYRCPDPDESNSITSNTSQSIKVKYIRFNHIPDFISSIMLHPLAPDWMDETVKEFCNRNNIKYLGKSKLYTMQY